MLTLYIGSRKILIKDVSNSLFFRVLPVAYEKNGKLFELRMSTHLPELDGVEIRLLWWKYFINLPVSSKLQTAILNFMLFKHLVKDDSFDCYSFACEVASVPQHDKKFLADYWELKPLFLPKVGDIVFFSSEIRKNFFHFHHAAIYLGFGRYFSVWGAGGQFEVATRRDMKKGFCAKKAYLAIPR